ncbi:MAG: hypothetical protein J0I49_33800 [Pseudonocardia sp.]|uniref:anti-sigma factor family protein n=1 Tax=Pseudonocardia sp. TaxID=60912 RepID=UPI001AC52B4F|nr:hypothetical protein [Pseudonocardia sp.]MBN9103033.1 hypothetical protein [Pseudonocardia sp.]
MTDLNPCAAVRSHSAELALGLVTGRERAQALAHLDECPQCRNEVEGLSRVQDALRLLVPAHDPAVGFENRVLAALPRPRHHRWTTVLAAAAAVAAVVAGGWVADSVVSPRPVPVAAAPAAPALRVADVVAAGRDVGQVFTHPGPPAWLYMYLDLGSTRIGGPVTCRVVRADGTRAVVGTFTLARTGDAYWGGPAGTTDVTAVEVTDSSGAVLATAHLAGPSG